ncbi:Crotonobetainyl-CoA:carnitine CoA-transferase CaiB [Bradyrhizobium sp. Ghvi]|uniref:CaiB/BaiF CoA transferase family protein n=1 Tax=Bradyrhizobium sp. Ghvi TaxID=1855319 RepID=UPI0008E1E565|nr:CaiB/BaiF CoA-transferase family protein [Bradyrhizobium sp. Ghvi]SFP76930.1 Crotonobetainyl-CoA:carnitine CoA-transferase CaiB [Bradyrhizobium sp. Ghvi]
MTDLSDIIVVAVEHAVAAPYASGKLADAGARVIKVERPEGDFARTYDGLVNGQSAYFVWLNRGKESIALDLKATEEKTLLKNMLRQADVFIQNLGPGVIESLGFSADELLMLNPRLVICNISGYGREGPRSEQKAYDLLIQAETGLCAVNGIGDEPARVGVSVCDIAAGMTAYQAILEGLLGRSRSGKGRVIDVSLYHSMADWMNVPFLQHKYGQFTPMRLGLRHPSIVPYGKFGCRDGKDVLISVQNEREWKSLCSDVLRAPAQALAPGFETNKVRIENRDQVETWCAEQILKLDSEEFVSRLSRARIAFGHFSELKDLIDHPQNKYVTVATDGGDIKLLAPGNSVRGESKCYGGVPSLDRDGNRIRVEFSLERVRVASNG